MSADARESAPTSHRSATSSPPRPRSMIVWVGLVAGVGMGLLVYATRVGMGLPPDAATYVGAAHSLLEGHGYAMPSSEAAGWRAVTHYPPLYSALLASLSMLGPEPLELMRGLHVLLLGANVLIVAGLLAAAAPGAPWLPVVGAVGIVASPVVLGVHAAVLTEPLFIGLTFASLGLLASHLGSRHRNALLASAVLAALASLTRYSGIALIAAAALVLLTTRCPLRQRVVDTASFVGVAALPLAVWMLRNAQVGETLTNRTFAVHPIGGDRLLSAAETMGAWVVAGPSGGFAAFLAVALGLGLWDGWRRRPPAPTGSGPLARVLLVFVCVYLGLLALSISFFDATTPTNDRILSPVFVALWVLALLGAHHWRRIRPTRGLSLGLGLLCMVLLAGYAAVTAQWAHVHSREGGIGFGSVDWRQSPTIGAARELAPDKVLYSNGHDALQLLAGRRAREIPPHTDSTTRRDAADFPQRIAKLRDTIRAGGVIVWLDWISWRWYLPELSELRELLPIRRAKWLGDGSIWIYAPARDSPDSKDSTESELPDSPKPARA